MPMECWRFVRHGGASRCCLVNRARVQNPRGRRDDRAGPRRARRYADGCSSSPRVGCTARHPGR